MTATIDLSENGWLEKLSVLNEDDWKSFQLIQVEGRLDIFELDWWNTKWYEWDDIFSEEDAFNSRQFQLNNETILEEIPIERRFGHPSRGRFACPQSNEVSFWSDNLQIADIETRRNEINDKMGVPLSRCIHRQAKLLDLLEPDCRFLKHLRELEIIPNEKDFYSLLTSEDRSIYPVTHAIAHKAFEHDYDGILFKSSRLPYLKPRGIHVQFRCIALYKENLIYKRNYSEIVHG